MTPYIQVSPQGNNCQVTCTPHFLVEFRIGVRMILSLPKLVQTFILYSRWLFLFSLSRGIRLFLSIMTAWACPTLFLTSFFPYFMYSLIMRFLSGDYFQVVNLHRTYVRIVNTLYPSPIKGRVMGWICIPYISDNVSTSFCPWIINHGICLSSLLANGAEVCPSVDVSQEWLCILGFFLLLSS